MNNLKKNYAYEFNKLQIFFKKILIKQRNIFYNIFKNDIYFDQNTKVLDIGSANVNNDYDNIFIKNYPYKNNITCLSDQDLDLVKKNYPKLTTVVGDGKKMNFEANSFDIVFSNAVLEHVGSNEQQSKFIEECVRVSRKNIFIITPYRYFPIEMHTKIPLLHFLPINLFRKILKFFGENFLSQEENLNLLTKSQIKKMCFDLNLKNYEIKFSYFLGFRSNLILKITL